ncbi:hypothetical protein HYH02_010518 [Chlamydomonas schloesseri]|uniref:RAP domain-containing protein n=1 Tax=Chlamydomonas schloesseri TaxID=2026947 RepID=A0A835W764_9CHLO|nr:hypothetical protein HYH02_010518 [Chlamydomonas schloesseri]|eukprot:KAG2439888.1 hypothetical protein HYH02_010518 [Chlamydomonas schloesseri]
MRLAQFIGDMLQAGPSTRNTDATSYSRDSRGGRGSSGSIRRAPRGRETTASIAAVSASGAERGSSGGPRTLDARAVTRDISTARSWVQLAEVVAAAGGPAALNEIHLAAAISRLAKLDLAPDPDVAARVSRSGGGAGNLGGGMGPGGSGSGTGRASLLGGAGPSPVGSTSGGGAGVGLAAGAMKGLAGAPPPPPPAPGGLPLSGFGTRHAAGPLPLSGVPPPPQPLPAPLGLTQRMPFRGAAGTPGLGSSSAVAAPAASAATADAGADADATVDPAGSPQELCVLLLEALAKRFNGGSSSHHHHHRVGDGMAPPQRRTSQPPPPSPPPPRVLANSVWGAVRLYLDLWPEQQAHHQQHHPHQKQSRRAAAVALRALLRHVPAAAATRSLQPQHVSNLLYSLARLQQAAPQVLQLLPDAAPAGGGGRQPGAVHAFAEAEQYGARGKEELQWCELDAAALAWALVDAATPMLQAQAQAATDASSAAAAGTGRLRERPSEDSFGPQALSNALWALAVLGVCPPRPWLATWLRSAATVLPAADPQHMSNMLWALARFQIQPGASWIRAALQAAALKAPAFTPQGLCNTLWALAKLECADALLELSAPPTSSRPSSSDASLQRPLLLPLLAALRGAAGGCSGQDVANGMWALARLRLLLPQAVRLRRRLDVRQGPAATADAVTATAWAVSAALQAAGEALLLRSARQLHSYSPQQLANTAWAAERLALQPPPEWVAALWPAATAALPAMRSEELVATAMAAVRLRLRPPAEWVERVLEVTWQMMEQDQADEEQAAQAQAQVQAGVNAEAVEEEMEGEGEEDGEDVEAHTRALHSLPPVRATGRLLASLLWCVVAWRPRLPASWTAALLRRLEALAARERMLEPQQLAAVLQALARMRLRPDRLMGGWTRRVMELHVRSQLAAAAAAASSGTADEVVDGSGAEARAPPGGAGSSYPDAQAARMILWAAVHLTAADDAPRCSGDRDSRLCVAGSLPVPVAEALALSAAGCCGAPVTGAGAGAGADGAHDLQHSSSGAGGDAAAAAAPLPEAEAEAAAAPCGASLALWALAAGVAAAPLPAASLRRLVAAAAAGLPAAGGRELASLARSLAALGFRPGQTFRAAFESRLEALVVVDVVVAAAAPGARQRPSALGEPRVEEPGVVSSGMDSGAGAVVCGGGGDARVAMGGRPGLTGAQAAAVLRGCAELRWRLPPRLAAQLARL